jgi:hypothetical protein
MNDVKKGLRTDVEKRKATRIRRRRDIEHAI